MTFSKVSWTGKAMVLEWSREEGNDALEQRLISTDKPAKEFLAALELLKRDVLALLELPAEYGETLDVRGLTVKDGGRALGVVVTSLKKLDVSGSPLVLNTPYLEDDGTGSGFFRRVRRVLVEAERYIEGHREQGDLFEGDASRPARSEELEPAGV